jgi:hypothetical protein
MTDALLSEIERVIFESHAVVDRDGTIGFGELLELRASRFRNARARVEDLMLDLSERIGTELEKRRLIDPLRKQLTEKEKLLAGYIRDRAKLVAKGSEARMERLTAVTTAAEKVRGYLRYFKAQEQSLLALSVNVD